MQSINLIILDYRVKSRNDVQNFWSYNKHLKELIELVERTARRQGLADYHFTKPVLVNIKAIFKPEGRKKVLDIPNIDDKVITDAIIRYQRHKGGKSEERAIWFIEDDANSYLKQVNKTAIVGEKNSLEIEIAEIAP